MADLFEGCSDEEVTWKTNNSYAQRYDDWRRKEELMKAKARYGSDLEGSSSSDEEEDDEASQWTSEHEKKFLTTLSALKARDPKIYNKDEIIFPEVSTSRPETAEKSAVAPKMTIKDYEREIMTAEGGRYVDEDDEQVRKNVFEETQQDKLAYDAEQRELRESLKKAAWGAEDKPDDEDDDQEAEALLLAKKKPKTDEEKAQDDEEYVRETKKLSNKKDAKDLATLKQLWSSEGEGELDDAEKFLRDYVLNKRYLTANEDEYRFEVDFSDDEKDVAAMTEFEHKYNFRFEDPDPDFIKRYPRTIEDSMRRKDTRRVDKKAEKKARKEQLKVQMKEEVNRLKSFKRKEILDKIEKLKSIAGSGEIEFDDEDIEGDFDPDEHDRRMAALFSTYDNEAGEENYPEIGEDEHDDLRWENWDNYEGGNGHTSEEGKTNRSSKSLRPNELEEDQSSEESGEDSESEEHGDRAEYSGAKPRSSVSEKREERLEDEDSSSESHDDGIERNDDGKLLIRGKKSAKLLLEDVLPAKSEKKRKKSKFAEAISKQKPSFDPQKDKSFEKYFDEYYKLDFEDVVAGQPTRFKYRQVLPNDFGLSTEEVLQAQDKELNKWCSLKKMVQYRSRDEEEKDLQVFAKRRDHFHLKKKILTSAYSAEEEKVDEEIRVAAGKDKDEPVKKSKSRKNKKKKPAEQQVSELKESNDAATIAEVPEKVAPTPRTAKKRKSELSDSVSETNKKKRKRALQAVEEPTTQSDDHDSDNPEDSEQKKSKTSSQKTAAKSSAASNKADTIPWDQLTPKQKKNRRNAMIKKRKKLEERQKRVESKKLKKQKFKPLEDLQISDARMKAYGLNPNRVKGNLVYAERKNKKQAL